MSERFTSVFSTQMSEWLRRQSQELLAQAAWVQIPFCVCRKAKAVRPLCLCSSNGRASAL